MNVLIVGGGGREHALAWKVAQSARVNRVFVAPGNAGTALEPKVSNVAIKPLDFAALTAFVRQADVALTIAGPDAPVAAGIRRTRLAAWRLAGGSSAAGTEARPTNFS